MIPADSSYRWLWQTPIGWLVAVSTLVTILYTVWVFSSRPSPQTEEFVSSLVLVSLAFITTTLGLYLISRRDLHPGLRWGWLFISLASFANLIGESLWFYFESILHIDPFPSPADFFYLSFYPLLLIGVLLFPIAPATRQERLTLWLDLAIVLTAFTMIFWYFILAPIHLTRENGLAGVIAVAYPLGDLLILAGLAALIQRDIEKVAHKSLVLLVAAMIFTTLADTLFGFWEINAISYQPQTLNFLWMAWQICTMFAVAWQLISRQNVSSALPLKFSNSRRLLRLWLPYIAAAVGLGMLLLIVNSAASFDLRLRGVLWGAMILVGLVLIRQYIVLKENIHLYQEMKQMASTDSLTGIYNRHFFNEVFLMEIDRARRLDQPLSVLLIDINGFKQYNDTYGHLQGDGVLRTVARMLASQIRSADLIARFGGDEFIAILPNTTFENAQIVSARIKKTISNRRVGEIKLSVSIGAATLQPGQSPEQLLETADQALYRFKHMSKAQSLDESQPPG